ncbi:MAG: response regulator [Lachnospiraceae bacterium]|nr:response regulator [Lachnospiraceae bacterium]MDD6811192.1 response regulator [Lachnospiraceae bacterium]
MNVICVDDEKPALDNFRLTVQDFPEIKNLRLFQDGKEAIKWSKENRIDIAFLDMEMASMHGLELAKKLKETDQNIRIIFMTAFEQYALQAFGVDAIGYILKPYTKQEVHKELEKAARYRPLPDKRIKIQTIPNFVVTIDGNRLSLGRTKPEELFALLVDRGDYGVTAGDAISCLWQERVNDENTHSLYRVTLKRLMDALKEAGIDDIIVSEGRKKILLTEKVDCDLYRMLAGEEEVIQSYGGEYMREYSWAETRTAQLDSIKNANKKLI